MKTEQNNGITIPLVMGRNVKLLEPQSMAREHFTPVRLDHCVVKRDRWCRIQIHTILALLGSRMMPIVNLVPRSTT